MLRSPSDLTLTSDAYAAWLRQAPVKPKPSRTYLPRRIVTPVSGEIATTAARELRIGLERLLGEPISVGFDLEAPSILLQQVPAREEKGGFRAAHREGHLVVESSSEEGLLYGVFALLRWISTGQISSHIDRREAPSAPIRYLNHWDNPGGTIERGYAGRSIFFSDDPETQGLVTADLDRVTDYARLLASVGINGCSLNNVNADDRVYASEGLPQMARLADAMRPYAVRTLLSVALESPQKLGRLDTFDPCDPAVIEWWQAKIGEIYKYIPDLAGLVLKADSEGRLGPSAYGRTHADAANMFADALTPYGGRFFYRGFVYDHRMDWRDLSLDRARAAYDNFKPLDGAFRSNALIQVKNGPIDFQVREPVSPCFAALEQTSTVIEFMITQEYLGQQRHTVYEVPWWKDSLEFDFQLPNRPSTTRDIVTGRTFDRPATGYVAVCGVGRSENWLGNHLAQANLYGYGRLTWDPDLTSEQIADEWIQQTFSQVPVVRERLGHLLMRSWPVYENYTGHLGIGGLTDIIHIHYGPSPISSEHNGWGQWHRSTPTGTGMNRTVATGTGFTGQYPPSAAAKFENLVTCPEELLLFFHHVPYDFRLTSGKTLIQHVFDVHYDGAEEAASFVRLWEDLEPFIDPTRYRDVRAQLEYQSAHAMVWRDAICQWFARLSGVSDEHGRVFAEPNRIEAEAMELTTYTVVDIEPWEAASGGRGIALPLGSTWGRAGFVWSGSSGRYDIATWYFDPEGEAAQFALRVDGTELDRWSGTGHFPSTHLDAHTKTRRVLRQVELRHGQRVEIWGYRDGDDPAGLDFMEITPSV